MALVKGELTAWIVGVALVVAALAAMAFAMASCRREPETLGCGEYLVLRCPPATLATTARTAPDGITIVECVCPASGPAHDAHEQNDGGYD